MAVDEAAQSSLHPRNSQAPSKERRGSSVGIAALPYCRAGARQREEPCAGRHSQWCCNVDALLGFQEDLARLHFTQHLGFGICNLALEFHRKKELVKIVWTECIQNEVNFSASFLYVGMTGCMINFHLFTDQLITEQASVHVKWEKNLLYQGILVTFPVFLVFFQRFWTLFYIDCNVLICE